MEDMFILAVVLAGGAVSIVGLGLLTFTAVSKMVDAFTYINQFPKPKPRKSRSYAGWLGV